MGFVHPRKRSLVILPFVQLAEDWDQQYISHNLPSGRCQLLVLINIAKSEHKNFHQSLEQRAADMLFLTLVPGIHNILTNP